MEIVMLLFISLGVSLNFHALIRDFWWASFLAAILSVALFATEEYFRLEMPTGDIGQLPFYLGNIVITYPVAILIGRLFRQFRSDKRLLSS